ncbi:hypothetical protein OBV_33780 [Oscillibacter valericigenes Sjm18-20]|nr:hypothetical protein OBV_33780 [Oscillibacter valericigenes Sjm18-20]
MENSNKKNTGSYNKLQASKTGKIGTEQQLRPRSHRNGAAQVVEKFPSITVTGKQK